MLVSLLIFLWKVKEPKLVKDMHEESRKFNIEEGDDEGGFGGRREERLADDRCRGAADEGRRGHGRRAGQGG